MLTPYIMLNFDITSALQTLSYSLIPVLLGIILHEVAHGYVALKKGDPTAKVLGRLTINPVPHIDTGGLISFVATSLFLPFTFGWAKPVPVNPRYFQNPRWDMMWVALAGPVTNMVLALVFALLLKIHISLFAAAIVEKQSIAFFLYRMFETGIIANFALAWINLIPIPPLDGSKILSAFLPRSMAYKYLSFERYGFILLILALYFDLLSKIIFPLIKASLFITLKLVGLS